jgi:rhamnogalacturonyl hydrolase YesR
MKKSFVFLILVLLMNPILFAQFDKNETLSKMHLAKSYFIQKWPDVGKMIPRPDRIRPSNIWTRAVFYEGLMELYKIDPKSEDLKYMVDWGEFHHWGLRDGAVKTRNADNQACGQVYLDLFLMNKDSVRLKPIKENIDNMLITDKADDWSWVDCLQMAMPVFSRLGTIFKDNRYYEKMYDLYAFTKTKHGEKGLLNQVDGLWYRDKSFDPPYIEPNGQNCYWSRGNAWVYAALVRTLETMPKNAPHREEYIQDYLAMTKAIVALQRKDGFWNVSLKDESNYGGPEVTGTALFVYGLAWGVNHGFLPTKKYKKLINNTWFALLPVVHVNGFLGFVQGTGKEPKDSQPVTYESIPDFEDFGLGCFLLAGVETVRMNKLGNR